MHEVASKTNQLTYTEPSFSFLKQLVGDIRKDVV